MKELIFNQHNIPKKQWRYGFRSSAATGCGWIATYNALKLMGYHPKPEKLIRWFTWQLPLINGNMGTFFLSPAFFFKQYKFPVKIVFRRGRFDRMVQESDVCILFYYWRKKWRFGAHFTALQNQDGHVIGYNTFSNSDGPDDYGSSLEAFLKKRKYAFPVLTCIRKANF